MDPIPTIIVEVVNPTEPWSKILRPVGKWQEDGVD